MLGCINANSSMAIKSGTSLRPTGILLAIGILLAAMPTSADAQLSLRLGHPGPANGMWGQLAASLARATAGRGVKIEQYPLIALGGERLGVELVRRGQIDLAAVSGSYLARDVPQFGILNLPLLARNISEARAIVNAVGPRLQTFANSRDLHVLAYTWVVGTFVAQGGCVLSPNDIKGARVLDGPPLLQDLFRLAGASPVPIPGAEVFAALQSGLSDKGLFSVEFILTARVHETTDCLTDPTAIAVMVLPIVLVASRQGWSRLDEAFKQTLMDEARKLEQQSDQAMRQIVENAVKTYSQKGKTAKPMDDHSLELWRKLAAPLYEVESSKIEGGRDLLGVAVSARSRS